MQSLKVSDKLASSDYLKLDKSLQKDIALMIQVAQKPRTLSAFFFTFHWEVFAVVSGTEPKTIFSN